jgi:hypothetical protein
MVEDSEDGDGDLASEEALLLGLLLVEEGGDYLVVVISSVELQECLSGRIMDIAHTTLLHICPSVELLIHIQGPVPMLRR